MAFPYLDFPSEQSPNDKYAVFGTCSISEVYRVNTVMVGACSSLYGSDRRDSVITGIVPPGDPTKRFAMYITTNSDGEQFCLCSGTNNFAFKFVDSINGVPGSEQTVGQLPTNYYNYNVREEFTGTYTTNIPIFADSTTAEAYKTAPNDAQAFYYLRQALNFSDEAPEGTDWEIMCSWTVGTWDIYGGSTPTTINILGFRGRILSGSVELVPIEGVSSIPGGQALIYAINSDAVFYELEKTTDGTNWEAINELPTWFYRRHENEVGTFAYAVTASSTDGSTDPPDEDPDLPGDPDPGTDWGDPAFNNFFSNQYICSTGALGEIANSLYDVTPGGLWEDIKKGLDMYGDNPMNSVMGLMYFPCDLTTVYTNLDNRNDIYFGGYRFALTSHTVDRIINNTGYFDCGGINFREYFKGIDKWRNTEALRLFVDLPYCGRYELDPAKYLNKFVRIIYYIDSHTGGCVACIISQSSSHTGRDGLCLDQFNGQMGVNLPITLTSFSDYANAQINTLLGGGGQAMIQGGQQISAGVNAVAAGATVGAVGAVAGAGALGALQGAKTVYGLQMNNINRFNQTRGGASAMLNEYTNQIPAFIIEYPEKDIPGDFYDINGGPSNYSGSVSSFKGYLECEQIQLRMPGATQAEKEKARALLMGGVYI